MPFAPAYSSYGFWIAEADGSNAKNYRKIQLPKELPKMKSVKPLKIYQMDEGMNHPGYQVFDTRKIDISHKTFEIGVGLIPTEELEWMEDLHDEGYQVLISWKAGLNVLAVWQPDGFDPMNYGLNVEEFGRAQLKFQLVGITNTTFTP